MKDVGCHSVMFVHYGDTFLPHAGAHFIKMSRQPGAELELALYCLMKMFKGVQEDMSARSVFG